MLEWLKAKLGHLAKRKLENNYSSIKDECLEEKRMVSFGILG